MKIAGSSFFLGALINTPLQRGELDAGLCCNRFNGFGGGGKPLKRLHLPSFLATPLKRGVNENSTEREGVHRIGHS